MTIRTPQGRPSDIKITKRDRCVFSDDVYSLTRTTLRESVRVTKANVACLYCDDTDGH